MSGRTTSPESYILTPEQIDSFHKEGCVTLPNVLTEEEVVEIEKVFDQFLNREIHVPGKDFCDMSKPFGIPFEEWSIGKCYATKYAFLQSILYVYHSLSYKSNTSCLLFSCSSKLHVAYDISSRVPK